MKRYQCALVVVVVVVVVVFGGKISVYFYSYFDFLQSWPSGNLSAVIGETLDCKTIPWRLSQCEVFLTKE